MPRDRLAELQNEAGEDGEEDVEQGPDESTTDEKFMADFFKKIKSIRDAISSVESKIQQVKSKSADLIVAVNKNSQKDLREQVNTLTDEISTISNRIRRDLKILDDENKKEEQASKLSDGLSADLRIRKSQQATLSRKFLAVMALFSEVQAENKQKQRDLIKRQCKIADSNMSEDQIEDIVENGAEGNIFSGKRMAEAEAALAEIQSRHQDILKLEKSLMELHEMFMDLSLMIESQGEMIDRIEFNVTSAANHVEKATKELTVARKSQSAARKKQVMIAICCLILIGVIVAAIIAPLSTIR